MTTNKTFLILLLAGVSYTAYNAAAVSENFEISTTIDHEIVLGNLRTASADANLDVTGNINMGTIIVNSQYTGITEWYYDYSGIIIYRNKGAIVSADNATLGYFTANVANPEACSKLSPEVYMDPCAGLAFSSPFIDNLFGGSESDLNGCFFDFAYDGENNFIVRPAYCYIETMPKVIFGTHTGTLTINYTPS